MWNQPDIILPIVRGVELPQKRNNPLRKISKFTKTFFPLIIVAIFFIAIAVISSNSDKNTSTATSPDQIAQGEQLYALSCTSCHGSDLRGTNKGPSHLSKIYEPNHHSDDAFRLAIVNGAAQHHWNFGNMLPVKGITDNEIEEVIAYVRSEQVSQGFEN